MARTKIDPLDWRTPIVDPQTGLPTPQFMRLWQSIFGNDEVNAGEIADNASGLAGKANASVQIIAGDGLSGGGDLTTDRTIDLDAVLDDLTDVDVSTVPPTNNQVLSFRSSDSLWVPRTVSGGGSGLVSRALVRFTSDKADNYTSLPILSWDTAVYDDGTHWDPLEPTKLQVLEDGLYRIACQISAVSPTLSSGNWSRIITDWNDSTDTLVSRIGIPSQIIELSAAPTVVINCSGGLVEASAGDYFVMRYGTESDTSVTLGENNTWFSIERYA